MTTEVINGVPRDDLDLIRAVLDGFKPCMARDDALCTVRRLLATAQPAADGEREVVSTAPDRIYLVIGGECPGDATFSELAEVSWCEDNIDGNGIEYVRAAQPAKAEGVAVPEGYALARETAVEMPDGSKELGYTVLARVGIFDNSDEVIDAIKQLSLPLGWVSIRVDQLLPGRIAAAPSVSDKPAAPVPAQVAEEVRRDAERWAYFAGRLAAMMGTTLELMNADIDAALAAQGGEVGK